MITTMLIALVMTAAGGSRQTTVERGKAGRALNAIARSVTAALTLLNCCCIKLGLVVAVYFCLESIYVVRMLLRKINFDSDK